ncbi:MAG: TetM/TetW/TetO/TetS family tetracycline resistance ribosomal protection protein [Clostridiales bacterium]|nr:TetM/TetW/TetO/TetS family tetracycline resistance ribosomal protection protein [Clostridiales bacterium]
MKRLVTGILAHVDSGKTTLSEAMLYTAGEIRTLGRVDHKDAFLDTNEIERDRGITIFSKQAVMSFGDMELTLLDTPGHVDFSAETERTLQVLDYAVLVISASDGVQTHTETLWRLLERYNVGVFIFVNKTDISSFSHEELMSMIKSRLGDCCVDFTDKEGLYEDMAMCSEQLMNGYLENGVPNIRDIRSAICKRQLFPCYFGSALKLDGVSEFMKGFDEYTKNPVVGESFGAKVFKLSEDEQGRRLTHMKITGGTLRVRDLLCGTRNGRDKWSEKVNQIRIYSGAKFIAVDEAPSGSVCAVTGLTQTYPGEGLGAQSDSEPALLEPVLSYSIILPDGADIAKSLSELKKLEDEDPQLHILWNEQLHEIQVRLMGEIQLEVLQRLIAERFGMNVTFGRGSIAYKETIAAPAEGIGHYEPLRHYAEVHLLLEPAKRGSGLHFYSDCPEDELDRNWQRLILTHLEEKQHIGTLTGSPITDINITLIAGRAHQKHTEGGDFRQATYRAVRHGLKCAESVLLEPWYEFRLEVPQECVGRALTDIQRMSGRFNPPETLDERAVITGAAPVFEMRDYHREVIGYTGGRGRLICLPKGYEECHNPEQVIEEIGYNSDNDLENPADSVFCSHGAGFVVKWDKVRDYMHIDTGISFEPEEEEEPDVGARVSAYLDSAASDKELMRIFEKTYGSIKSDKYHALQTRREPAPKKKTKVSPIPKGPEYLLVDGYNIIFAWEDTKKAAEQSLEAARGMLIDKLCNYQGYRQCELILVFDAYKVKGNPGEVEKIHNISVVYTKEAETADMYIEKTAHKLGRKRRVRVATSDALEQLIILGSGAIRVSAQEFRDEVEQAEQEIREFIRTMRF